MYFMQLHKASHAMESVDYRLMNRQQLAISCWGQS